MTLTGFKARNHPQQTLVHGPRVDVDERGTPPELFAALDRRFRFTIDVAALPHNRKCTRYFAPPAPRPWGCMWEVECLPVAVDGLRQPWHGERVWCNPPYSNIRPWVEKATQEWGLGRGVGAELIVMLLPANRTEQAWWQELVEPYRDRAGSIGLHVEFLAGRFAFDTGSKVANSRPPFGCCLLIWGGS